MDILTSKCSYLGDSTSNGPPRSLITSLGSRKFLNLLMPLVVPNKMHSWSTKSHFKMSYIIPIIVLGATIYISIYLHSLGVQGTKDTYDVVDFKIYAGYLIFFTMIVVVLPPVILLLCPMVACGFTETAAQYYPLMV